MILLVLILPLSYLYMKYVQWALIDHRDMEEFGSGLVWFGFVWSGLVWWSKDQLHLRFESEAA